MGGQFATAEDEADLRAVAVGHGDIPAGLDHAGDVIGSLVGGLVLVLDGLVLLVLNQRIAADGDDSEFFGHRSVPCEQSSGR